MTTLTAEEIKKSIYEVAEKRSINVIEENVDVIVKGLIKRYEKFGGYYCPCRIVKDDDDWKEKVTCPCIWLDDEIDKNGRCHCNLYKKKEK